jgi:hypothetical protein
MNSLVMLKLKYGPAKFSQVDVETYPDYSLVTLKTSPGNLSKALQEIKELLSYPLYSYDVIADLKNIYGTDIKGIPAFSRAYYELNREFTVKITLITTGLIRKSSRPLPGQMFTVGTGRPISREMPFYRSPVELPRVLPRLKRNLPT